MKIDELDTKEVTLYILNDKVFELDRCPDWAQYASVDEDGHAYWYESKPEIDGSVWINDDRIRLIKDAARAKAIVFDATDWQHSLIERPDKCAKQ